MNDYPLITVVTVVFNGVETLEKTILSILNQSYPRIEYIIKDGGSVDGTLSVIKKYEKYIDEWISSTDSGIYDAMNLGIEKANGEWINFMNSGDSFVDEHVLMKIFSSNVKDGIDIIYGNVHLVAGNEVFLKNTFSSSQLGVPHICHQSTFIRSAYIKNNLYDASLKICADFKLLFDYHKKGGLFLYKNVYVSCYDIFGFSFANLILYQREMNSIVGYSSGYTMFKVHVKALLCKFTPSFYRFIYCIYLRNTLKKFR